jgi:hypothetical protein
MNIKIELYILLSRTDNAEYNSVYVGLHEVLSHVSGLAFSPSKTLSTGKYRCTAAVSVRNVSVFGEVNVTDFM